MRTALSVLAFVASLGLSGTAFAQSPVSGGPEAKGNAPLKAPHTVNDGAAKAGANSFTEGQARKHILKSGYSSVSGLSKGSDGVWRGMAVKSGASVKVALDFKGNVTDVAAEPRMRSETMSQTTTMSTAGLAAAGASSAISSDSATAEGASMRTRHHHVRHHHHRRRHHHHHHAGHAAEGAAMSGIDRNQNGISDKEDRARR